MHFTGRNKKCRLEVKEKIIKLSLYTPWRHMGGEEV
jgi:hypothetical protein